MYELHVSESIARQNSLAAYVLRDYAETKKRRVKIYSMEVENRGLVERDVHYFIFQTTSKDVFLGLGAFTQDCRLNLARLIEDRLKEQKCSELLLSFADEAGAILVTRTTTTVGADVLLVTFTLSPAH